MKVLSGSLAYLSLTSAEQVRDLICPFKSSHLKAQNYQVMIRDGATLFEIKVCNTIQVLHLLKLSNSVQITN